MKHELSHFINDFVVFYNPHPQGKFVDDCVKRSITKVTGWDYRVVSTTLNRIKRSIGAKKYSDLNVTSEFLERMGWKKETFQAVKGQPRMNGKSFCTTHKQGKYILRMAGHWVACVDGLLYDTWDCSDKCVYWAVKVE